MLTAWSFFAYNVILYYVKKASIIFYYKAKQMNVKYTLFFLLKLCNNKYAITTKNEIPLLSSLSPFFLLAGVVVASRTLSSVG